MYAKRTLILADSSFHLLLAAALSRRLGSENCVILFLGKDNSYLTQLFFKDFSIENFYEQDLSFFNIQTKFKDKITELKKKDIKFIFTFYDTNHVFEFLKSELSLSWNDVGLIDDGSASLHRVTMPKLYRRLPKALFNFSLSRFPVNLSRYNLGGNPKIKFFATIYLNYVYISNLNSKVIDINSHYNNILNNRNYFNLKSELISGSIIMLSPVLAYRRKTELELFKYLNHLLSYCDKRKPIYFKPHPRENLGALKNVISKLDIKYELLSSVIPMELYFPYIVDSTWLGMPSTSIFNRVFTGASSVDRYIIIQETNDPFPERLITLSKVFKDFSIDYKIFKS